MANASVAKLQDERDALHMQNENLRQNINELLLDSSGERDEIARLVLKVRAPGCTRRLGVLLPTLERGACGDGCTNASRDRVGRQRSVGISLDQVSFHRPLCCCSVHILDLYTCRRPGFHCQHRSRWPALSPVPYAHTTYMMPEDVHVSYKQRLAADPHRLSLRTACVYSCARAGLECRGGWPVFPCLLEVVP